MSSHNRPPIQRRICMRSLLRELRQTVRCGLSDCKVFCQPSAGDNSRAVDFASANFFA